MLLRGLQRSRRPIWKRSNLLEFEVAHARLFRKIGSSGPINREVLGAKGKSGKDPVQLTVWTEVMTTPSRAP